MNRHAVSFLEIKALDADARTIEGWASRPELDRVGDIVESKGAQFRLPLPLLMDHNHTAAVGEVFHATVTEAGIRFKAKIAKIAETGSIKDLCDSAWSAAKAGLRKAVSIGFRPIAAEPLGGGGTRFTKWEWYELSMVAVPALASATIDQVKALDRDLRLKQSKTSHVVVKLGAPVSPRKALPVVRLGSNGTTTGRPIAEAMLSALDKSEAERKQAEEIIRKHKALGTSATLIDLVTAGTKATDAELAALKARLDRLERG